MGLVTVVEAETILNFDDAQAHCRFIGNSDQAYVELLIKAATLYVEGQTRRALGLQTLMYTADQFPWGGEIRLERPPFVQIITNGFKYINDAGVLTVVPAEYYTVDDKSLRARVVLNEGYSWPTTGCYPNAVQISYQAGKNEVEADLKLMVLFLVEHWYMRRSPVPVAGGTTEVPHHLSRMLLNKRVH